MSLPEGYRSTFVGVEAMGEEGTSLLPPPSAPMDVARKLAAARYTHPAGPTLMHWRGGWWEWRGAHWAEIEQKAMAAVAYRFTEHAVYKDDIVEKPWAPSRRKIGDLLDALAAVAHLAEDVHMPAWLDGTAFEGTLVSVANGLLDVATRALMAHTPTFFNSTSVPFEYNPDAPPPQRWLRFLN